MNFLQVVFILTSAVTLGAAVMVVTSHRMIRAALWLVLALFGVAILFALLQAGFFAVVQVVVYIGAIAILVIFAVMLTRHAMQDEGAQVNRGWWAAVLVALGTFAGLAFLLLNWAGIGSSLGELSADEARKLIPQMGQALVSADAYVLPFEVASVLLLAALIGAIYIAREKNPQV
ncbi:MAG TPA: NADH-quinone oxidoreductase subunit J [Anaerolineaceae bacterium]|nr:NADH-quinone oxidoreductase subunit J [Anaerolineaceae bacterium]